MRLPASPGRPRASLGAWTRVQRCLQQHEFQAAITNGEEIVIQRRPGYQPGLEGYLSDEAKACHLVIQGTCDRRTDPCRREKAQRHQTPSSLRAPGCPRPGRANSSASEPVVNVSD